MTTAFDGLTPAILWDCFKAITQIPRGSGNEAGIRDWMLGWAEKHGFVGETDEIGNLLIRVPGSAGKENNETVILQGHLDMVCEKNSDVEFDFDNEGIRVIRDGDWLKADGTTLGADNGIGIAIAMAAAVDPVVANPPLELLFTIEEETGLTGASNLKTGWLTGKRLINIDSEEEGYLFAGCAGGADTDAVFPAFMKPLAGTPEVVSLTAKGMIGGHSGLTIHENRANAVKIVAMVLHRLRQKSEFRLVNFVGGDKHNAIPREATAIIAGLGGLGNALELLLEELKPAFLQEFGGTDPKLTFVVESATATEALSDTDSLRLLQLILALPHGVDAMSKDIDGLVETSSNVASIRWEGKEIKLLNSSRSSIASALDRVLERIGSVTLLAGGRPDFHEGYPGWQPNMDSELLAFAKEVYKKATGNEAVVTAIHAGLECGIIGEAYPGLDTLSFGPDMFDVHSPDERLAIASTQRFFEFFKQLMAAL